MTNNFRALCADLIEAVLSDDSHIDCTEIARRARAALGEADEPAVPEGREPASVTGQPSDAELLQMMPEQFRADLATVSRMAAHGAGTGVTPGVFRVSLNTGALDYARAVLARWGSPAPAPTVTKIIELSGEIESGGESAIGLRVSAQQEVEANG